MKKFRTQLKQLDVLRKLKQTSIIKIQDYDLIIDNLKSQNQRLKEDQKTLGSKVKELQAKNKKSRLQKKSRIHNPEFQYSSLKQLLNKRYEQLSFWQKKSQKSRNKLAIQVKYREYLNECIILQREIQKILAEFKDRRIEHRRINKGLKEQRHDGDKNRRQVEWVEQQNKQFRRKIWDIKRISQNQEQQSINVHNMLIAMINQDRKDKQKLKKSYITQKSVGDIAYQQLPELNKYNILQLQGKLKHESKRIKTEVQYLENKIDKSHNYNDFSVKRQGSTLNLAKQKIILLAKNKLLLQSLEKLNQKKIKLLLENYQKIDQSRINLQFGILTQQKNPTSGRKTHLSRKTPIHHLQNNFAKIDQIIQTQEQSMQELNYLHEYAGVYGQIRFNDAIVLPKCQKVRIKSINVFQCERGLSTINAVYEYLTIDKNWHLKKSPFHVPQIFLQKNCKVQVVELSNGDFVKQIKVRTNKFENRISKIQIISMRNVKYEFGEKNKPFLNSLEMTKDISCYQEDNQRVYRFNINKNEYPRTIIGSHRNQADFWLLQSLGVEIAKL